MRPLKVLTNLITQSRKISAISPIFYPDHLCMFEKIVNNVRSIELVLTEEIWKLIKIHVNNYSDKLKVYVIEENPNLTVIASDKFLSDELLQKVWGIRFLEDANLKK